MAVVMISHSAKEDVARDALTQLEHELTGAGLTVWVDRERLGAATGVQWRTEISRALHTCRAAVVLISPSALTSEWVKRETNVLTYRRDIAAGFPVLPILLDVEPSALDAADWEPTAIRELQALIAVDGRIDVSIVIDRLRPLVDRYPANSPERRLENVIEQSLQGVTRGAVESAAAELKLETDPWESTEQLRLAYAQRLLEVQIEQQVASLNLVADVAPRVARELLRLVAPHGWIPADAGPVVRAAARRPSGWRAFALNTRETETCEMYVGLGFCQWMALTIEGGWSEQGRQELESRVRAKLLEWDGQEDDDVSVSNAALDAKVQRAMERDYPLVVLPPGIPPRMHVEAMREGWPSLPVLVRCADDDPAKLADEGFEDVTYVRPPVDGEREQQVLELHRDTTDAFGRQARR